MAFSVTATRAAAVSTGATTMAAPVVGAGKMVSHGLTIANSQIDLLDGKIKPETQYTWETSSLKSRH